MKKIKLSKIQKEIKKNPWMISTLVLVVIVIILLISSDSISNLNNISKISAGEKVMEFVDAQGGRS